MTKVRSTNLQEIVNIQFKLEEMVQFGLDVAKVARKDKKELEDFNQLIDQYGDFQVLLTDGIEEYPVKLGHIPYLSARIARNATLVSEGGI
jgi:hypothetical protein